MTGPLEAVAYWSAEATAATTARNEAIVTAREAGASLRTIAAAAELSHNAVAKILARSA